MILDFIVLRSGLPIFTINFDPQHGLSHDQKKFTLISGFLSAISSFVNSVDNLGQVDEIQMSSDIFFSFKRLPLAEAELLFVLASNLETPKNQRKQIIEDASAQFMGQYCQALAEKWDGNVNQFRDFNDNFIRILKRCMTAPSEEITQEDLALGQVGDALTAPVVANDINANCAVPYSMGAVGSNDRFARHQMLQYYQSQTQGANQQLGFHTAQPAQMPWMSPNAWTTHGVAFEQPAEMPTNLTARNMGYGTPLDGFQTRFIRPETTMASSSNAYMRGMPTEALYTPEATPRSAGRIIQQSVYDLVPAKRVITVETFRRELDNEDIKVLFVSIDGRKSIQEISNQLDADPAAVLDACQFLVKKGLIQLVF